MKNELTIMHEMAMEFVDEARRATQKGDRQIAQLFFQKAFQLEKFVALQVPQQTDYQLTRSVFFRSAANLALQAAHYEEAKQLAETALTTAPHTSVIADLKEIVQIATTKQQLTHERKALMGRLVAADLPNYHIKLQINPNHEFLSIEVPKELFPTIVQSYWEKMIVVDSVIHSDGSATLEEVALVA